MLATQLHPLGVIETVESLSDSDRLRMREALQAAGPQAHARDFEFIVLPFFSAGTELESAIRKVAILRIHMFASTNQDQEDIRAKAVSIMRRRMEALLEKEEAAASLARKCVEELVDHHLLVERGDKVCPNFQH